MKRFLVTYETTVPLVTLLTLGTTGDGMGVIDEDFRQGSVPGWERWRAPVETGKVEGGDEVPDFLYRNLPTSHKHFFDDQGWSSLL